MAVLAAVAVAGCGASGSTGGSGSAAGSASPAPTSTASAAAGGVLRAVHVAAVNCSLTGALPALVDLPVHRVTAFVLCPLEAGTRAGARVRVPAGSPAFDRLARALTARDAPRAKGACPLYAEVRRLVFATTAQGPYLVRIPVDGCGHYRRAAMTAWAAADRPAPASS